MFGYWKIRDIITKIFFQNKITKVCKFHLLTLRLLTNLEKLTVSYKRLLSNFYKKAAPLHLSIPLYETLTCFKKLFI